MLHFSDAALAAPLLRSLERMGFTTPTPIQAQAIPVALEGKDILGSAQTGTGKTAAFGVPLANNLLTNVRGSALVLLPTRELAVQVMQALTQIIGDSRIATALLIGGEPMPRQLQQLRNRPRLIVGTPGRINDHLKRGTLMLHDTNFLVLDETDRMLDMGFGIQLDEIARYLTAKRQTLMFSATLPSNIMKLAGKYLTDPVRISAGVNTVETTKITQETFNVSDADKYAKLLEQLSTRQGSIIVFVKTKYGAEKLANKLCKQDFRADALHGDLRQNKRDRVIGNFRNAKFKILVATDIAARGLDIPHIEHVINYDLPQSPEDYIHRIGRTARAGAEGAAVNLLTPADNAKWKAIQKLLNPTANPTANETHEPRQKQRSQGGRNHRGSSQRRDGGKPRFGGAGNWEKRGENNHAPRAPRPENFGNRKPEAKDVDGNSVRREDGNRPQRSEQRRSHGEGFKRNANEGFKRNNNYSRNDSAPRREDGNRPQRSEQNNEGYTPRNDNGNAPRSTDGNSRPPRRDGGNRKPWHGANNDNRGGNNARRNSNGNNRPRRHHTNRTSTNNAA